MSLSEKIEAVAVVGFICGVFLMGIFYAISAVFDTRKIAERIEKMLKDRQ